MISAQMQMPPGHELEEVARRAATTVPTVRRFFRGEPGKPRIDARIIAALRELGGGLLLGPSSPPPTARAVPPAWAPHPQRNTR